MGNAADNWVAIATGVLISTISAGLIWALRKLASIHPPANGKAAAKIAEQIRQELADAEEIRRLHRSIQGIRAEHGTLVTDMVAIRQDIHAMSIRLGRLERAEA